MTNAAERDPESFPETQDPSGPCPRCGQASTYGFAGSIHLATREVPNGPNTIVNRPTEQVAVLICAYCQERVVVVEQQPENSPVGTLRGVHWWPTPGVGQLSADVPDEVVAAYDEAKRCLSASAPNGAVALLRTALTYIVQDKGSEAAKTKGDLKEKLAQMITDGGPVATLADWMTHVRLYGNAGAHPDLFGQVSLAEAREVAQLTYSMIDLLYLTPARIARRRAERFAQSVP